MDARDGIELRCSAIVTRQQAVLLIHRTYDGADDWVLPGGTPRSGESTAACTRREVREETGLWVDPARVAFVLEVVGPETGPRTLDIVFAATESAPSAPPEGRERGMEPLFVPAGRLNQLDLRPPLAGLCAGCSATAGNATPRTWPTCGARTAAPPGRGNRPVQQTRGAHTMTQQHLIGELSVCLEQLQAATTPEAARDVARLRHQVEMGTPADLGAAALRALALADGLCWESLSQGDTAAFARQSKASADLRQFGVCARLFPEGSASR